MQLIQPANNSAVKSLFQPKVGNDQRPAIDHFEVSAGTGSRLSRILLWVSAFRAGLLCPPKVSHGAMRYNINCKTKSYLQFHTILYRKKPKFVGFKIRSMRIWLPLLKSVVSKPPGISSCAMTSRKMHMEERLQEKISREQADDKRGEFLILFYFAIFKMC